MFKLLMGSMILLLVSCGADQLAEHQKDGTSNTAPESLGTDITIEGQQDGDYGVLGMTAAEVQETNSTAFGSWCAGGTKKVHEFRCGLGNPGANWVIQPDGCYHKQTQTSCKCEVGPDWYDDAIFNCSGSSMMIVDACGYEKEVTNHPSCVQSDGIYTNSRSDVVEAYNNLYRKPTPAMEWTGDIASCKAGTTSLAFQQRVIDQISFYRVMTGLKPVSLVPNSVNNQSAALIMDANYRLSHYPDNTWKCYSDEGSSGARSSNLALGANGVSAINLYMDDHGAGNSAVGHRRWILYPPRKSFATGDTPRSNSLATFLSDSNSYDVEYVAWPSAGYFPYRLLPQRSKRWSFSLRSANFSDTTVSVRNITDGTNYNIQIEPIRANYGWDTIVFIPQGLSTSRPARDTVYEVKLRNVKIGSSTKDYTYRVIIIDP